ncbi:hypothetical protein F2Q68_00041689 [Brassica cretica]|uniref:Uncharacterized protein n=1 Tax=Brassica cretica TaxID=69181 RepID=A0A8S9MBI1_BRACR|nr:hypothetical protein F2Q68_00041689 [Brassica cretica]
MTEFPSTTEITVASSLLLLSYGPVFFSPTRLGSVEKSSYVSKWCDEGSSNLSLILKSTGSGSFGLVLSSDGNDRGFEIKYAGDRFSLMNLKVRTLHHVSVIQSNRNRVDCSLDRMELKHWEVTCESFNFVNSVCDLSTCSVDSKEELSCLSTGSSEVPPLQAEANSETRKVTRG